MTEIIGGIMIAILFLAIYFIIAKIDSFKVATIIFLLTGIVVIYIYVAASLVAGTP